MNPEIPVLVVTLHIPVQHDTSVGQVMEAVGQEIEQAIESAKDRLGTPDPEAPEASGPRASEEALEPTTEATAEDLLSGLGYKHRDP